MAKEVHATTPDVKVTKRVITAPPSPQTVRIYHKDGSHQDVFPVDANEIVSQGEYTMEPVETLTPTVGENVYKPVRPETMSAIHPEATVPMDSTANVIDNTVAEEDEADATASLRGPLPDDFPHRTHLEAAGFGTYARARKLVAKGEGWHKDVDGIGEKSFKAVEDALKEK